MYRFDDEKAFVDSVDDQLVALLVETGSYYTFNEIATALVNDLNAGYELSELVEALQARFADADVAAQVEAFMADVLDKGIMDEVAGEAAASRPAMACATCAAPAGVFAVEMDGYDDVAAYFMIDPIHEVDPDMGWPVLPEE